MIEDRAVPWTQDYPEVDVWGQWDVILRDLFILDRYGTLITKINLSQTKIVIGKNTKQAVVSGFYWGYSGLIEKIISKISKITKKNFKIILTGGLAHLFKTNISLSVLVDKNLTIKGLIKAHKILNK